MLVSTDTMLEDTCSDVNLLFAYFWKIGFKSGSVLILAARYQLYT